MIKFTVIAILCISISTKSDCPWGNEKVCGVDYITYENQCAIAAAYVEVKHLGPCTKVIVEKEDGT